MLMWAGWIIGLAGLVLIWRGWRRRVGNVPHCRRCGFDLRGRDSACCPECGRALAPRRATVRGQRRRSWVRIVAGFIAALLGIGVGKLGYTLESDPMWWLEKAPASWLVHVELPLADPSRQHALVSQLHRRWKNYELDPDDFQRVAHVARELLKSGNESNRRACAAVLMDAASVELLTPEIIHEVFRHPRIAVIDAYRAAFHRGQVSTAFAAIVARASLERQAATDEPWEDAFGDPILIAWSIGALTDAEKVQFLHAAMPIDTTLGSTNAPDRVSVTVHRARGRAARRRMDVWPSMQFQPSVGVRESSRGPLTIDGTVHQIGTRTSGPGIDRFDESTSSTSIGPSLDPGWHDVTFAVDFAYHEQNADGTWRELTAWTEELEERVHIEGFATYHDLPALHRMIREAITIEPVTIEELGSGGVKLTIIVHCAFDGVRFRIFRGPNDSALYDDGRSRWRGSSMQTSSLENATEQTYTFTIDLSERLPTSSLTIPFTFWGVEIDGTTIGRLRDPIEITIPLP